MKRIIPLLMLLLAGTSLCQAEPTERRLLRIESRIYGWYAVAEPDFDRTIGRRELFRVGGGEQFLKGLDKRLVVLEGRFQKGVLTLPALSPPPVSMPADARRQSFVLDAGSVTSEDGFVLRSGRAKLPALGLGRWKLDLVVSPGPQANSLLVEHVLAQEQLTWSAPLSHPDLSGEVPFLELELTQDLLDAVVKLGLQLADLEASWQGLTMKPTHLRLLLPDQSDSLAQSWSLQGSMALSYGSTGALAETSFICEARPLIEKNWLYLEPDWKQIRLEGQLPLPFQLGTDGLGRFQSLLPKRIPVANLNLVTKMLVKHQLLGEQEQVNWFLAPSAPGTVRLGLAPDVLKLEPARPLKAGRFRFLMSDALMDRVIRREARRLLSPEEPFRPVPPIEVGKALFVPILVDQIFVRALEPGYNQGAFRFTNLTVDVGWRAGPLQGVEPLVSATGFIIPKLERNLPGSPYFSWILKIEQLIVRSDKLPGDKQTVARELVPKAESQLGPKLAAKRKLSNRFPLAVLLGLPRLDGATLEVLELEAQPSALMLEGRLL